MTGKQDERSEGLETYPLTATHNRVHCSLLRTDNNPSFFSWFDSPSWPWPSLWGSSITHTHAHAHTHQVSSGRGIGLSQRPVPDDTQHQKKTDVRDSGGIRAQNSSKWAVTGQSRRLRGYRDRRQEILWPYCLRVWTVLIQFIKRTWRYLVCCFRPDLS